MDIPDVSVFCLYMIFERFGFLEIRKKIVGIFYIVANILIRKSIWSFVKFIKANLVIQKLLAIDIIKTSKLKLRNTVKDDLDEFHFWNILFNRF